MDPLREVDENKSISISYMIVVYQNILWKENMSNLSLTSIEDVKMWKKKTFELLSIIIKQYKLQENFSSKNLITFENQGDK